MWWDTLTNYTWKAIEPCYCLIFGMPLWSGNQILFLFFQRLQVSGIRLLERLYCRNWVSIACYRSLVMGFMRWIRGLVWSTYSDCFISFVIESYSIVGWKLSIFGVMVHRNQGVTILPYWQFNSSQVYSPYRVNHPFLEILIFTLCFRFWCFRLCSLPHFEQCLARYLLAGVRL